ncbi:hypothetical protein Ciccas_012287, partial [Cichlidogyrus casuarinus]
SSAFFASLECNVECCKHTLKFVGIDQTQGILALPKLPSSACPWSLPPTFYQAISSSLNGSLSFIPSHQRLGFKEYEIPSPDRLIEISSEFAFKEILAKHDYPIRILHSHAIPFSVNASCLNTSCHVVWKVTQSVEDLAIRCLRIGQHNHCLDDRNVDWDLVKIVHAEMTRAFTHGLIRFQPDYYQIVNFLKRTKFRPISKDLADCKDLAQQLSYDFFATEDEEIIFLQTQMMRNYSQHPTAAAWVCLDTTYGVCISLLTIRPPSGVQTLAVCIHKREDALTYATFLRMYTAANPNGFGGNGSPLYIVTDNCPAERKGIATVLHQSRRLQALKKASQSKEFAPLCNAILNDVDQESLLSKLARMEEMAGEESVAVKFMKSIKRTPNILAINRAQTFGNSKSTNHRTSEDKENVPPKRKAIPLFTPFQPRDHEGLLEGCVRPIGFKHFQNSCYASGALQILMSSSRLVNGIAQCKGLLWAKLKEMVVNGRGTLIDHRSAGYMELVKGD